MTNNMQINSQGGKISINSIMQYMGKPYVVAIFIMFLSFWMIYILKKYYQTAIDRFLMKDIIDLNKSIMNGKTLEAIRLARKNPSFINIEWGSEGFTPFLRACIHGNTQVVKYMILLGADLKSCTKRQENAFYLAIYERVRDRHCNDASCIHTLYHAGVDINACNSKGYNALQLAATFGHTTLVRWLLSKDANYLVEPSPYVLAKSGGHRETAKILKLLPRTSFEEII